jgi:hypothetical protein
MIFGIALIAAGAAALTTPQSSYPAAAALGEFKSVCIEQPSFQDSVRTAEARGWQRFRPAEGTPMAAAVAMGQKMLSSVGVQLEMPAFWKNLHGHRLEMVLTSVPVPFDGQPRTLTGCNMYDFDATAPLPQGVVRSWAGRDPTSQVDDQGVAWIEWKPGLAQLPSQTKVAFVPPQLKGQLPLTGIALISDIFEEAK